MLDEFERRQANFDQANSVGVVLADDQVWWLPKPWLELRPVFEDGKVLANYKVFSYGPSIDFWIEAIGRCELLSEQMVGVASLAAYLLRWHYALEDKDLDLLLAYRLGDKASEAWRDKVMEVATGQSGPKRFRAGGG